MSENNQNERIIILGAGPTGLGAATQLQNLGHNNWILFERTDSAGGLASSVKDDKGFTWDLGGHVQFSHYEKFDTLMDVILPNAWLYHVRSAWIWMRERFISYPFQYNFNSLPKAEAKYCSENLPQNHGSKLTKTEISIDFEEWIKLNFGEGIANSFMFPYNKKVWAYPLHILNSSWIGGRVAKLKKEYPKDEIDKKLDNQWGPNSQFRFPLFGGTGTIWTAVSMLLPLENIRYNYEMISIDTHLQKIKFSNGHEESYDKLISTIPLDVFIYQSDLENLKSTAKKLLHSSTFVVGIGIKGKIKDHLANKSWIYFPEDNCPFYRITIFSNYSPNNVPKGEHWSIMAEVSSSGYRTRNSDHVIGDVIAGLMETKFLNNDDLIVSKWMRYLAYGYPTPTVDRDECLDCILPSLSKLNIYSRGRFGAWKYEVSNQDHSYMQGVECVNHLLNGDKEITLWNPGLINQS